MADNAQFTMDVVFRSVVQLTTPARNISSAVDGARMISTTVDSLKQPAAQTQSAIGRMASAASKDFGNLSISIQENKGRWASWGETASSAIQKTTSGIKSVIKRGFDWLKTTAAQGDALAKTAARLGLTTPKLQALNYAAESSGVATKTFNKGMEQFMQSTVKAAKGSGPAADAFAKMGISLRDNQGKLKSQTALFEEVADAMQNTANPAERLDLARAIFGKNGEAMVNMLKDGSAGLQEYEKNFKALGGGMTEKATRDSEIFIGNLSDLQVAISGISNQLYAELVPSINSAMGGILEWVKANKELIRSKVKDFGLILKSVFKGILSVIKPLIKTIGDFITTTDGSKTDLEKWQAVGKGLAYFLGVVLAASVAKTALSFARLPFSVIGGLVKCSKAVTSFAMKAPAKLATVGKSAAGVAKVLGQAGRATGTFAMKIGRNIGSSMQSFGGVLGRAGQATAEFASNARKGIGDALKAVVDRLNQAGQATADFASNARKNIGNALKPVGEGLNRAGQATADFAKKIGQSIGSSLKPFTGFLGRAGAETTKFAKAAGSSIGAALKPFTSAVWSATLAAIKFAVALLANPITWIVLGIMALIAALVLLWKKWDTVVAWLEGIWDKVVEAWDAGTLWDAGVEMISGLWEGIKSIWSSLVSWLEDSIGGIGKVIGAVFDYFSGDDEDEDEDEGKDKVKANRSAYKKSWKSGPNGAPIGADQALNQSARAQAAAAKGAEARVDGTVRVQFENAPKGTRLLEARQKGSPGINVAAGLSNAMAP